MMGKPRPNSDRSSTEAARQPSSGALTGMGGVAWTAAKARAGFFAAKRPADPALSTMRSAAAEAQKSRLPQMAAALAYRTIFGLLPVIVVALVAVKFFASEAQMRSAVEGSLEYSGLSAIALPSEAMGPPQPIEPIVGADATAEGPGLGDKDAHFGVDPETLKAPPTDPPVAVDKWITGLIENVNNVNVGAITLAGAAMLVYAAMSMLVEIERAFNQIYRVPRGRSWIRRVMQYWTLLTLGPLALIATFYVGQQFMGEAQKLAERGGVKLGSGTVTMTAIGYAATVAISTVFFFVAYISVPNTKVRIRPALVGALSAALLWEAGKWGFTQYLAHFVGGTTKLYGALSLLPLFLLWVYFTWLIVLFGLQIAYELQHGRAKTLAQPMSDYGPTLVDPAAALVVLTAIARAFDAGKMLDAPGLAKATSLPDPVVRMVLGKLAERGMLHRVGGRTDEDESCFALAKSPSSIRVSEILELGYELAGTTGSDEAIARLHRAQIDAMAEQTLASIAGLGQSPRLTTIEARSSQPDASSPVLKERSSASVPSRPGSAPATLAEPG